MQQSEMDAAGTPQPPTLPSLDPQIWSWVLPTQEEDGLRLGGPEHPTDFLMHLAGVSGCTVGWDAEGCILSLRWRAEEHGAAGDGFQEALGGFSVPFVLLHRIGKRILVSDPATLLGDATGIAIKRGDGEIEFIKAEDILGLAFRPANIKSV